MSNSACSAIRFALCALALSWSAASAQSYPAKPIRWIIPFAPGGGLDLLARAYAAPLGAALGQPVVPDNRPASSGIIALEFTSRQPPDGYTLLIYGSAALRFNRIIYTSLKYDAERDFTPVTLLAKSPMLLFVNASVPAANFQEFVAHARSPGSKLAYGAAGHGHTFHLSMELLKQRTGAELLFVPYKGMAPVVQDVVSGQLQAMFYPLAENMIGFVKAGKVRTLASYSGQRLPALPDVPTFEELGVRDFNPPADIALFAPGGLPREIVARLNAEIARLSRTPELAKTYEALAWQVTTSTPEELLQRQRREYETWAPLLTRLGIKLD